MTTTPTQTIDELATRVARIRSYVWWQARRRHVALVPAADALELLEYVSALERELGAMRSAATRAELERDGVVDNNEV